MPRRRLRKFTLWTGTLLCVLIAAAFVVSAWWRVALQVPTTYGPFVEIVAGAITVFTGEISDVLLDIQPSDWSLRVWNYWEGAPDLPLYIVLPLYAVFLAVAVPTLLVWRFVPKFPPGHCRRCGYNLKGLTEARCPECGTGFGGIET